MAPATSVVVMMGVSGAGKSTVARGLAERLGWDFAEGDELHSPQSIAKMAMGLALTDADRAPWLARVAGWIDAEIASGRHGVITCSALKRAYRDVLRRPGVLFVHLSVPRVELEQRVTGRPGHFMPASLLASQLDSLEPPAADEAAVSVEATGDPARTIETIAARIVNLPTGRCTI